LCVTLRLADVPTLAPRDRTENVAGRRGSIVAQPRDVFTMAAFGREPKVSDLLLALPEVTASALVGAQCRTATDADAAASGKSAEELKELVEKVQLVLQGGRLDRDEIGAIAKASQVSVPARSTAHQIAFEIIAKLGMAKARSLLEEALKPGALDSSGTFTHFGAPLLPDSLDVHEISARIETALEPLISMPKDKRVVKARAEMVGPRLVVAVYFQRGDRDGRRLTSDRKLSNKAFARSAGCTWFAITNHETRSRVMFRSSPLVDKMRAVIGEAVWGKPRAIDTKPHAEYNLAIFKKEAFKLSVEPSYIGTISKVRLTEIDINSAMGNSVRVKAPGVDGDALSDFHAISKKSDILVHRSAIQAVAVKFTVVNDKRRRPLIKITPTTLTLDEQYMDTVRAHLLHWGVLSE
jgi:hypothetical protein